MPLYIESSKDHKKQFERLLQLRVRYPGARDDQLLMHMLIQTDKKLEWLSEKIVGGEEVFPLDEMHKAVSADNARALFDEWLSKQALDS